MIEWVKEHRYKYIKEDPFNVLYFFGIFIILNLSVFDLYNKSMFLKLFLIASIILTIYPVVKFVLNNNSWKLDEYTYTIVIAGIFYSIYAIIDIINPNMIRSTESLCLSSIALSSLMCGIIKYYYYSKLNIKFWLGIAFCINIILIVLKII